MNRRSRLWIAPIVVFAIAALVRFALVERSNLWVDEFFSLAVATGHSLEHPAAVADPSQGDYVELGQPVDPSVYANLLNHETPPASPSRIIRATLMSDTNPPLYYLLLYGWTRTLGTSDAALRCFSVFFSLACLPFIWSIARQTGGRRCAIAATLFFAIAPMAVNYSIEGRMYSLMWFWICATAWLTLRLHHDGFKPLIFALWILASAGGLYTHYFFMFVWGGLGLWLLIHPGALKRGALIVAGIVTVLLVLPWYVKLPQSLAAWRVTQDWIKMKPGGFNPLKIPVKLITSYFIAVDAKRASLMALGVLGIAALLMLWRSIQTRNIGQWVTERRQMLWLWLGAALAGPIIFDIARGTYVSDVPRYVISGLPAAMILLAYGITRLESRQRIAVMALLIFAWGFGIRRMYMTTSRSYEPFHSLAQDLAKKVSPDDVIIVHSIPSGVVGMARYLEMYSKPDQPVRYVGWVGQLGQRRVPEDVQRLIAGASRVHVVVVHPVGEKPVQEEWLTKNATPAGQPLKFETTRIHTFTPRDATTFAADTSSPRASNEPEQR